MYQLKLTAKQCFKLNLTRTTQYSTSIVVSNIQHHQSLTSKHTSPVSKRYFRISTGDDIEWLKLPILSDEDTNALLLKMDLKRKELKLKKGDNSSFSLSSSLKIVVIKKILCAKLTHNKKNKPTSAVS